MRKKILFLILIFIIIFIILSSATRGIKIKKIKGNQGKRWAVCVGINDYIDDSILDLQKARNDASEIGRVLKKSGQFDYVFVMTDDLNFRNDLFPLKSNIEQKIDFILEFASNNDLIVFTFSGHGISNNKNEGFLLPFDARSEKFFKTSIKVEDIVKKFKKKGIKKTLLVLDACREEFVKNKGINDIGLVSKKYRDAEVAATFFSTKAGWYSYEDENSNYGVFSKYLIEGLKGEADLNKDNLITFSEIEIYVQDSVTDWSLKHNKKQKPYTRIYGEKYGDLILTMYEKKETNIPDNMILVEGSIFLMGSSKGGRDEKPIHRVKLDNFYIDKYEISQKEWEEIMGTNPSLFKDEKLPADNITWYEAVEFCNKKSIKEKLTPCYTIDKDKIDMNNTSKYDNLKWIIKCNFEADGYRLPTEAEWEYAARGGINTQNYKFSGSNNINEAAWYSENVVVKKTNPSGQKNPNELGIFDMSGNLWEWCWDWYDSDYYKTSPISNPTGSKFGSHRVLRGGAWDSNLNDIRVSYRNYGSPKPGTVGLRIVRRVSE